MRRNRSTNSALSSTPTSSKASQLSTAPILFNHNSNSCSNDTNCSSLSSLSNVSNLQTSQAGNQIVINEQKIRNLLKELQVYVKKCHQERSNNEPNLVNINKTHEKIRKEEKISPFYRKKLRTLYFQSLNESELEIKSLRQALDCINQIRHTQNDIRLLQHQQQNQSLSSTSSLSSTLLINSSPVTSGTVASNNATLTYDTERLTEDATLDLGLTKNKASTTTMRRGVLMSILQQAALTLPLWVGEIGQSAPALCGSMPPESNYICKPGDKVAAIIKNNITKGSKQATADEENEDEENFILAEVIAYHSNTSKYEVEDVDSEEGLERYTLSKKRVIPLPLWRANPLTDPEAIFAKDSFVLALYPQTTCFYRGIVSESPSTPQEDYLILFEDNTYPEGYSPPLNVPQLYVVADRNFNKKR